MLSLALKNGILIILIILIVHFLLKNYLMENKTVKYQDIPTSSDLPVLPLSIAPTLPTLPTHQPPLPKDKDNDPEPKEKCDEIFNYLFKDSNTIEQTEKQDVAPVKTPQKQTNKYFMVGDGNDTKPVFEGFSDIGGFESFDDNYEQL